MNNSTRHSLSQPSRDTGSLPHKRRWFSNLTLRAQLIIAFLLFGLIPLLGLAYMAIVTTRSTLTDTVAQTSLVAASEIADDLDAFIQRNLDAINREAQLPTTIEYLQLPASQRIGSPEEQRMLSVLQSLGSKNPDVILSYAVLDDRGRTLLDTVEATIRQRETNKIYFMEPVQTGQPYVSPVLFDSSQDKAVLYFSSPVRNAANGIIGVLRVQYDASVLQQIVAQHNRLVGSNSSAALVDENNILLAHGTRPSLNYKTLTPLNPVDLAQLQKAGLLSKGTPAELSANLPNLAQGLRNTDDTENMTSVDDFGTIAVEKLETRPWRLMFLQPQEIQLLPISRQAFEILFFLVLMVGLVLIGAFNIAGRIAKPFRQLVGVSRQMASGALGLSAPISSQYEARELAKNVNQLTIQLRDLNENMEKRVSERTKMLEGVVRSLETTTQIGRQITTILDIDELLQYVVERLQSEFNFYYTQIYFFDEESDELVLTQGSGEAGRKLKAQGYRQKVGEGIVGTVAKTNEYFLSNDVSLSPNYVPLALVPETKSELALPLRKGGRVLGVLDIQSKQLDRFAPAELPLFQSIANQTAIAIDNARLLAETQSALDEVERLNRRLTREGWSEITQDVPIRGYRFSKGRSIALTSDADFWLPPMEQAAATKEVIKQSHPGNGHPPETELAVPLVLRGEVIGVLGVKREKTPDWAAEELSAVEAVADQITRALENARLSEEQEKTIEQLKEVDRLKSEFLTSMSHELRTPLNSIIGFADVLLQGIDGELNEMAVNDVRLIYNSGQHLLALINDILDISKIEAGMLELVREPLDMKEVVNDVLAASNSLVKDKPVKIVTDVADGLPPVYADKLRLSQVLLNLVSNSAKFTHEGSITIKANLDEEVPNKMSIAVIDTGIGIPPNKVDTIFDRFQQADSSTTRQYGGTGLGLAITKQLVEMHDGELKLTSEIGTGSEFYFTIPLVEEAVQEQEE